MDDVIVDLHMYTTQPFLLHAFKIPSSMTLDAEVDTARDLIPTKQGHILE